MYIKKVHVEFYRNFYNTDIDLEEGLNVLIGANNTGKSNLTKVIGFLNGNPYLSVEDINKNELISNFLNYLETPPMIKVHFDIQHTLDLTKPDSAFEKLEKFLQYKDDGGLDEENNFADLNARIEMKYELDPIEVENYKDLMKGVTGYKMFHENLASFNEKYQVNFYNIESNAIIEKKYVSSIFEIESIDAERPSNKIEDVSKPFVKSKIEEVDTKELTKRIRGEITKTFQDITDDINTQIRLDQKEIGITNGKNEFVSTFGFDGDFTSNFQYILENTEEGYSLPVSHNGLGYNNLIYISNKIKQKKDNDYNVLLIEEPEAHLHPNMQYQLIKYIEGLKTDNDKGIQNQIIVTTHSPNISASTNFDHMILFNYEKQGENVKNVETIRFGDCFKFSSTEQYLDISMLNGETEKKYNKFIESISSNLKQYRTHLEKFLDITRSDMLFSTKVILVEGISEKLTIPMFADLLEINLIDKHIVIEEVGGITFNNFLPVFLNQNKKAVCFTDCDYKYVINNGKTNTLNSIANYSDHVTKKCNNFVKREFRNNQYFRFFTQSKNGSTFETELILENYDNCKNFDFIVDLVELPFGTKLLPDETIDPNCDLSFYIKAKSIVELNSNIDQITPPSTRKKVKRILDVFIDEYQAEQDIVKKDDIEKIFFVYLLYSYIEGKKGNFALNLASSQSIRRKPAEKVDEKNSEIYLKVPTYIKEGLEWLLK